MTASDQLSLFRPLPPRAKLLSSSARTGALSGQDLALVRVDPGFQRAERFVLAADGHARLQPWPTPPSMAAQRREQVPTSWVEHVPGWLSPDDRVFEALMRDTAWQKQRREMYDRIVDVPRLLGRPSPGTRSTTLLLALSRLLSLRYGRNLTALSFALYRDGSDSVAPHGDKLGALIPDTVVAILSVGQPRTLRLRPRTVTNTVSHSRVKTPSIAFALGRGDLFVMGGRCQADWLHGIPKTKQTGARISIMFREET